MDVVPWKMVSGWKGSQAVLTVLLFPWGLQPSSLILDPSVLASPYLVFSSLKPPVDLPYPPRLPRHRCWGLVA
jgi:hypothetical protein